MKKNFGKLCLGGVLLFSLSMSLTSCDPYLDDVLGEWSRPTPVTPTVNPDVTPEPPANPMLAVPLTLEVTTAGTIVVKNPRSGMQYSTDGGVTKTTMTATTTIPTTGELAVGDKVQFYGNGTSIKSYCTSNTDFTKITGGTAKVKVYGNIMSLVDEEGFADNKKLTADNTFYWLFDTYNNLTDASGLQLPATTLTKECYSGIFHNCSALTTVPEKLPAESLASNCYQQMFYGCSKLTTAPELPAENLAPNCYEMMFSYCNLTTAPALPAKILATNCYESMFSVCKFLTATPKLPAESLVTECYKSMFSGCNSLTTAYVKAAYNATDCADMFFGCTAAGTKTLHTTAANKASWDGVMPSTWAGWTTANDWTD